MATYGWTGLAKKYASRFNVPYGLVIATVWAESEGNHDFIGDKGEAFGFGQVWPSVWPGWFQVAAEDLKIELPKNTFVDTSEGLALANHDRSLATLAAVVKNSAEFSMQVAVRAIAYMWSEAPGNAFDDKWTNFTRKYVGGGIPDWDLNRRKAIMDNWSQYEYDPGIAVTPH